MTSKYQYKVQKNVGKNISCPQDALNFISDKYGLEWDDHSKLFLTCEFISQVSDPEKFYNYLIQQAEFETTPQKIT